MLGVGKTWQTRVRHLERLGLMTDAGRAVLPDMNVENFKPDEEIVATMKSVIGNSTCKFAA